MKRILVVEDHPDTQEFLRSMLELSSQEFQVMGVPSGEVTEDREMSVQLGAVHYFEKPLDAREFLTAVFSTVARFHGRMARLVVPKDSDQKPSPVEPDRSPVIQGRLETLRLDTGAAQIMVATRRGKVLHIDGETQGPDATRLAGAIAAAIENSFKLSRQLNNQESQATHYLAGHRWDLYAANIGRDHFLAMLFASDARRGRIGTIWLYAQRAIRDLKEFLSGPEPAAPPESKRIRAPERPLQAIPLSPPARPLVPETPVRETPVPEPTDREAWPIPVPAEEIPEPTMSLTPIAASKAELETLLDDLLTETIEEAVMETFWDEALSGNMLEEAGGLGINLEEARRQGILPTEFDPETGE
jgi:predicted regulator of Ras-like GTPase activity (Roadblock/LC7/MglB family)